MSWIAPPDVKGAAAEVPLHHAWVPVVIVRRPGLHPVTHSVVPEDALHVLRPAAADLWPALGLVPLHQEGAVLADLAHNTWIPLPRLWVESVHHVTHLVVPVGDDLLHVPRRAGRGVRAVPVRVVPADLEGAVFLALRNSSHVPAPVRGEERLHPVPNLVVDEDLHLPDGLRRAKRRLGPSVRVVPADVDAAAFAGALHGAVVPGPVLWEDGSHGVANPVVGECGEWPEVLEPAVGNLWAVARMIPPDVEAVVLVALLDRAGIPLPVLVEEGLDSGPRLGKGLGTGRHHALLRSMCR
mmetsp:Transcript_114578/g.365378  ORF Transcript_114578/g.365378 Transcript_114578/m.365378 type:complete len:297 (-) Transcript_114578:19-909(-)